MQKDIGTWLDSLENVSGQRGCVKSIRGDGILAVDFGHFCLATSTEKKDHRLRYVNPKVVKRLSQGKYINIFILFICYKLTIGMMVDDYSTHDIDGQIMNADDVVRLFSDRETVAQSQSRFGKYDINMDQLLGQPGVLKYFDHKCDPVVVFAGQEWLIDAQALRKIISGNHYSVCGDHFVVRTNWSYCNSGFCSVSVECGDGVTADTGSHVVLSANKSTFKHYQSSELYGGWNERMVTVLGKEGTITAIGCHCYVVTSRPDCFVTLRVGNVELDVNPKLLTVVYNEDNTLTKLPRNVTSVESPKQANKGTTEEEKTITMHPELNGNLELNGTTESSADDPVDKIILRRNSGKLVLNLEGVTDMDKDDGVYTGGSSPLSAVLSESSDDSRVSSVMSQLQRKSYLRTSDLQISRSNQCQNDGRSY